MPYLMDTFTNNQIDPCLPQSHSSNYHHKRSQATIKLHAKSIWHISTIWVFDVQASLPITLINVSWRTRKALVFLNPSRRWRKMDISCERKPIMILIGPHGDTKTTPMKMVFKINWVRWSRSVICNCYIQSPVKYTRILWSEILKREKALRRII